MECMICGKLFPRGPVDLARHSTAVTLKHLFQEKKSSFYNCGPCIKCGLHFTTDEHFKMHKNESSCKKKKHKSSVAPEEIVTGEDSQPKEEAAVKEYEGEGGENDIHLSDAAVDVDEDEKRTLECKSSDLPHPYIVCTII